MATLARGPRFKYKILKFSDNIEKFNKRPFAAMSIMAVLICRSMPSQAMQNTCDTGRMGISIRRRPMAHGKPSGLDKPSLDLPDVSVPVGTGTPVVTLRRLRAHRMILHSSLCKYIPGQHDHSQRCIATSRVPRRPLLPARLPALPSRATQLVHDTGGQKLRINLSAEPCVATSHHALDLGRLGAPPSASPGPSPPQPTLGPGRPKSRPKRDR